MRICHIIFISFIFLFILATSAMAQTGLGISGKNQEIFIDGFPFHFERTFTLFNTGDRDSLYTISIATEYSDIASWFTIEPKIVALERGDYQEVSYRINAEEGYSGKYDIKIRVIGYGDGVTNNDISEYEHGSYIKACGSLDVKIDVSDEAGLNSLGIEHPQENKPICENSYFQEIVKNIDDVSSGIMLNETPRSLYLDVPNEIFHGQEIVLDVGFIGKQSSNGLKITLISPSGKSYVLDAGEPFIFKEVGSWGMLISFEDNTLLGRGLDVIAKKTSLKRRGLLMVCSLGPLLMFPIYMKRRKTRYKK